MLESTFRNVLAQYGGTNAHIDTCWQAVKKRYTAKSRYYHDLTHIENMLNEFQQVEELAQTPNHVVLAIFYHDVVYKSTRSDNEHQSALLFQQHMEATDFNQVEVVMKMIEATQKHAPTHDTDTQILLDLDLAVLGKDLTVYRAYSEGVREEYRIYPDFVYRKGRKKVLQQLLDQPEIYQTAFFKQRYETPARENLAEELLWLS